MTDDKKNRADMESEPDVAAAMSSLERIRGKGAVNFTLLLSCFSVACATFLNGFDNVVLSPIAGLPAFVLKYQGIDAATQSPILTAYNQNLIFALPYVGSICGSLAAPLVLSFCGRKWTLMAAYALSLGMVFLQLFAPTLTCFVIGRLGNLTAIGIIYVTAPLYLSEVVPPHLRGAAVATLNITVYVAGLVATIVVNETEKLGGSLTYKIPLAVQCGIPGALIAMTVFLPESPLWLVSQHRIEDARKSLRKLRRWSNTQVDHELQILGTVDWAQRSLVAGSNFWQIFNQTNISRTLFIGAFSCGAYLSGVLISTTYITIFLIELGTGSPFTITVVAIAMNLAGAIVAPFIMDRFGRRPVALAGIALMLAIDVIAGSLAFRPTQSALRGIVGLCCLFNFVWAATYGPLSMLVPTEIATPKLRDFTMSYVSVWIFITGLIANFVLPHLTAQDAANLGAKTYLVFAGCMAIWLVLTYFGLPETAGRTFAEIDQMYAAKIPMSKFEAAISEVGEAVELGEVANGTQ